MKYYELFVAIEDMKDELEILLDQYIRNIADVSYIQILLEKVKVIYKNNLDKLLQKGVDRLELKMFYIDTTTHELHIKDDEIRRKMRGCYIPRYCIHEDEIMSIYNKQISKHFLNNYDKIYKMIKLVL